MIFKRKRKGVKAKDKRKMSQIEFSEVYRQLRTNLEYSVFQKNLQVLNVTSTNPDEGKSTIASNLAIVSAAKYSSVLLVDCDLRKPAQHKIFGVSNKIGISDLMKNFQDFDVSSDLYFQKFKDTNSNGKLYLLTSGTRVPNPQELLASERFIELIEKLKSRFEFIIIDCSPISVVADAIPISNICDGTIFVVSSKETNKKDAKIALTQLQRSGAVVLGSVLTKVENTPALYSTYLQED